MRKKALSKTTRRGFSALEFQVALILLGIALAGMVPLVVMQAKQLKVMEDRWDPDWSEERAAADYWLDPYRTFNDTDGPVYYLVPPRRDTKSCSQLNPWARKLGAPAKLVPREGNTDADDVPNYSIGRWGDVAKYTVTDLRNLTIKSMPEADSDLDAQATVTVTEIPESD